MSILKTISKEISFEILNVNIIFVKLGFGQNYLKGCPENFEYSIALKLAT